MSRGRTAAAKVTAATAGSEWVREPRGEVARAAAGGAAAIGLLAVPLAACNALGLMTLDFGRVLGTLAVRGDVKPRALGWGMNVVNGVLFGLAYQQAFRRLGMFPGGPAGALLGVAHGAAAMGLVAALPALHPRPREAGLREPGPFAYGPLTVPAMLMGHVVFGALTGAAIQGLARRSYASGRFLAWLARQEQEELPEREASRAETAEAGERTLIPLRPRRQDVAPEEEESGRLAA